jgi:electron transport complex protein RnfC
MLIKASWSPVAKPLQYERLPAKLPQIDRIDPSATVTLLLEKSRGPSPLATLNPAAPVTKFQTISLPQTDKYVISPVSGSIVSVSPYSGDYGQQYHAVSIKPEDTDRVDEKFAEIARSPSLENARQYLACLPGNPPLHVLSDPAKTIRTIIINGLDDDLLLSTNQYVMAARMEEVSRGIEIVKTISGIDDIVVVTVKESLQGYGHIGASVHGVDSTYPAALPQLILLNVLNREVPAGSN